MTTLTCNCNCFPGPHEPRSCAQFTGKPDVSGLTDKEQGDHVLIALTSEECLAAVKALMGYSVNDPVAMESALSKIMRSVRDQKGIED